MRELGLCAQTLPTRKCTPRTREHPNKPKTKTLLSLSLSLDFKPKPPNLCLCVSFMRTLVTSLVSTRLFLVSVSPYAQSYKFRLGVAKAIKHGKVVRLMREAKHSLRTMISKAGLDPDDYVDKLVASRVTAGMLPEMTASEITTTGILMGDAIQLVKALKSR